MSHDLEKKKKLPKWTSRSRGNRQGGESAAADDERKPANWNSFSEERHLLPARAADGAPPPATRPAVHPLWPERLGESSRCLALTRTRKVDEKQEEKKKFRNHLHFKSYMHIPARHVL